MFVAVDKYVVFFTDETQQKILYCQAWWDEERAIGYRIPFPLWQLYFYLLHMIYIRLPCLSEWLVGLLTVLKTRRVHVVFIRVYMLDLVILKKSVKCGRIKARTIGAILRLARAVSKIGNKENSVILIKMRRNELALWIRVGLQRLSQLLIMMCKQTQMQ